LHNEEVKVSHGFKYLFSSVIVIMLVLVACSSSATPAAAPTASTGGAIANPASVNCEKQGGKLTIEKRGDGGEFGVCWFEDALQCEEWALMRSECPAGGIKVTGYGPQGRYCAITGGQYTMTGGDMTNEKGTCAFKNGKTCDGADYFNGKCTP
jgi:putative hemolysin